MNSKADLEKNSEKSCQTHTMGVI